MMLTILINLKKKKTKAKISFENLIANYKMV